MRRYAIFFRDRLLISRKPYILAVSVFMLFFLSLLLPAATDVYIDIHQGGTRKINIVVVPFSGEGALSEELTTIIEKDLEFCGVFNVFRRALGPGEIEYPALLRDGMDALVRGEYEVVKEKMILRAELYDLPHQQKIVSKKYKADVSRRRRPVHIWSDEVVFRLTGERGVSTSKIAFVRESGRAKEIYAVDYDGYNMEQLTRNGAINILPRWSPDNKDMIYTSYRSNKPSLFGLRLEKREEYPISVFPGLNTAASWSPDGESIVLTLTRDGNAEVYLYEMKRRRFNRLTFLWSIDTSPSFSPNGRQIVFTSDRSGTPQLYVMDKEGTNLRQLTFYGNYNDSASWSPSGDRIVFVSKKGNFFDIYTISPDGQRLRRLTSEQGSNENPSWSPDGKHIVFSSNRSGRRQIYVMRSDGTGQRLLASGPGEMYAPAWSGRFEE